MHRPSSCIRFYGISRCPNELLAIVYCNDALIEHAETVALVLRWHDTRVRLRVSKDKTSKRLADVTLAPLAGERVEVRLNIAVAARHECPIVELLRLRIGQW